MKPLHLYKLVVGCHRTVHSRGTGHTPCVCHQLYMLQHCLYVPVVKKGNLYPSDCPVLTTGVNLKHFIIFVTLIPPIPCKSSIIVTRLVMCHTRYLSKFYNVKSYHTQTCNRSQLCVCNCVTIVTGLIVT